MKISAPNYTQTPNDLFDYWLPHLGEGELKVLLVIMRKTFGWHKTHDDISISQLSKYTGMLEETVIKATKSLQSKGVITREVTGPNGKQKTKYSLVVSEDNSNNSYPSVEPRTPLGLDRGVSTEAQKKQTSSVYIKETTTKETASPNVVVFSKNKEHQKQIRIYDCLNDPSLPLNETQKRSLCKFSEDRVIEGLKYTKSQKNPPINFFAYLLTAIQNGWKCPPEPKEQENENRQYSEELIKKINKNNQIIVESLNKYVEFNFPGTQKQPIHILYADKNFKSNLHKHLNQLGLTNPETFNPKE